MLFCTMTGQRLEQLGLNTVCRRLPDLACGQAALRLSIPTAGASLAVQMFDWRQSLTARGHFLSFFLFGLGGAAWFPPPFGWSWCFSISFLRGAAFLLLPWVVLRSPSLLSGGAACSLPSFLGWCCLGKISPPKGEKEDHSTKGKTATPPKEGGDQATPCKWRGRTQHHQKEKEKQQLHQKKTKNETNEKMKNEKKRKNQKGFSKETKRKQRAKKKEKSRKRRTRRTLSKKMRKIKLKKKKVKNILIRVLWAM